MKTMRQLLFLICFLPSCYTSAQVVTIVRDYEAANYQSVFMSAPVSGQQIGSTHPSTPYRMIGFNNVAQQWTSNLTGTEVMVPGLGYIETTGGTTVIGETSDLAPYNQTYTGTENSGNIYVAVSGNFHSNLLGNPYRDFLDADSFLLDPDNASVISGPIYLWSNNTAADDDVEGPEAFNFTTNDYALYNVLGGVSAGRAITPSTSQNEDYFAETPNGKIYMGTGFWVLGYGAGGNAVFKDSMRDNTINPADAQYFRTGGNSNTPPPAETSAMITPPNRHRIWINLEQGTETSPTNPYRQALIGYAEGATYAGNDRVFDAKSAAETAIAKRPAIDIYTIASGSPDHLSIQGHPLLPVFDCDDYFQLGFRVANEGDYTFTATADGMFGNGYGMVPYKLWDNGELLDFPQTYHFAAGEMSDTRFRVVFKSIQTQLNSSYCNITLPEIGAYIHASSIPGAEAYTWTVTNQTTGQVGTITTTTHLMHMQDITSYTQGPVAYNYFLTHNTVYSIHVSVKVDGIWYACGSPCTVTTPPLVIDNNVNVACDGTMPFDGQVSCTTAAPYAYSWEVRRVSDGQTRYFETASNGFILFGGASPAALVENSFLRYNAKYCVKVRVMYGPDNYGAYTPECCFWTPNSGMIYNNAGVLCEGVLPTLAQISSTSLAPYSYNWHVTRADGTTRDFTIASESFIFFNPATSPAAMFTEGFFKYDTQYCFEVRPVYAPDEFGPYSFACCYTTPAPSGNVSNTNNPPVSCGGTLVNGSQIGGPSYFDGIGYRWHVVRVSDNEPRTFDTTGNLFLFFGNLAPAGLTSGNFFRYNTAYDIQVAPLYSDGTTGAYTSYCRFTTVSYAGIISSNAGVTCGGATPAGLNHFVYCTSLPSAYSYNWEIIRDNGDGTFTTVTADTSTSSPKVGTFANIPALYGFFKSNKNYCFRVRANYNSTPATYSDYGPACCFTITNTGFIRTANPDQEFEVLASENPFKDYFTLDANTAFTEPIRIRIYDMLGKLLEIKEVHPGQLRNVRFGENLSSGVYNVILEQRLSKVSIRVIKE